MHKFSLFVLWITIFNVQQFFIRYVCFITNQSLYNLFPFLYLFFFQSYYCMSLNQMISHSIYNKLYKKN
jgi:hypothetical protein